MIAPARRAAFDALTAVTSGHADLPRALEGSRRRLADERDRSLAAAIVQGTLRWQRTFDHLIEHFASRSLSTVDSAVGLILRLSLFQLLHLDRVPAAAVVDDAVNLVRAAGHARATGFVNAVLRSTLRHRRRLPLPVRPKDVSDRKAAIRYLGVTWSHPDWLVARWLDRATLDQVERWVQFNNEPAPVTLSVNSLRASREQVRKSLAKGGIETVATAVSPHGLLVLAGSPPVRGDGVFLIQDEASQLVPLAVEAASGERVLDLCAAPGGKTMLMSAQMRDTGVLVACDVRLRRVALLRRTIQALGARHVHAVRVGEHGRLPFSAMFDRVLVDAPCSGLGTIRRDPDIKWRRQEDQLAGYSDRQVSLLCRAAEVVRPGGRLVYATCSSEPEENERVVDRFLACQPRFRLLDLRRHGPAELAEVLDDHGRLRTLPYRHGLEAFFAAAMKKSVS